MFAPVCLTVVGQGQKYVCVCVCVAISGGGGGPREALWLLRGQLPAEWNGLRETIIARSRFNYLPGD